MNILEILAKVERGEPLTEEEQKLYEEQRLKFTDEDPDAFDFSWSPPDAGQLGL